MMATKGLAIMVTIASSQTATLEVNGVISTDALNSGFHATFVGAAIISVIATVITIAGLKIRQLEKTSAKN